MHLMTRIPLFLLLVAVCSHSRHGAARRARHPLQPVLRHERLLADADLDHDRPERRPPPRHQLDQSRQRQRRTQRPARVELEGLEKERCHPARRPAPGATAPSMSARPTSDPNDHGRRSRSTSASTSTSLAPFGAPGSYYRREELRHGAPNASTAPSPTSTNTTARHLPHRGPHDRGQEARRRRP